MSVERGVGSNQKEENERKEERSGDKEGEGKIHVLSGWLAG